MELFLAKQNTESLANWHQPCKRCHPCQAALRRLGTYFHSTYNPSEPRSLLQTARNLFGREDRPEPLPKWLKRQSPSGLWLLGCATVATLILRAPLRPSRPLRYRCGDLLFRGLLYHAEHVFMLVYIVQ
ncbi:hypothetical protein PRNP1_007573 [Phytophthora ramorum]